MMKRLDKSSLEMLMKEHLSSQKTQAVKQGIVDAVGSARTNDAWTVLTECVMKNKDIEAELVLRSLVHFIGITSPPPKVLYKLYSSIVN